MIDRLIFLCGLLLIAVNGQSTSGSFVPNGDYVSSWTVEGDQITFNITGKTLGWLGFGMAPGQSMAGADLVIGGVRNGTPYLYDRHGTQNGFPPMDDKQDYEILGAIENATHTSLRFRRKLKTDDSNDYQITGSPIYLLWSMQTVDAKSDNDLLMHDRSGASAFPENLLASGSTSQSTSTQRSNTQPINTQPTNTQQQSSASPTTGPVVVNSFDPNAVQYYATIQLTSTFQVSWVFDSENITFQVVSATKGWAGLGFSGNGAMTGADIVVFWVDNNGRAILSDRHGVENGYPPEDKHQDYTLLYAARNDTSLRAVFRRKRITCDTEDMPLTEDTVRLIYAWNDVMPVSTTQFEQHTNKGSQSVLLFQPVIPDDFQPTSDMQKYDIFMDKARIPDNETTLYLCKILSMPRTGKRHLIRYEAVVEPGNEDIVHHVVIYGCTKDMTSLLNKESNCFEKSYDEAIGGCRNDVIAVWAVGGKAVTFPDDVGMPMFDTDDYPFALVEMHYSNPKLEKGRMDSSGIRLWTTSNLRKIEAGILTIGLVPNPQAQMIPPNVKEFTNYAHCSSECTSYIPKDGVQVYSALLHTHLAGRKVRVLHYRNGTQLPNMFDDEHYDFNYQEYKQKSKPVTLLPGDQLVTECIYTTAGRNTTLYGGFATYDEMCFAFLYYYPSVFKSYTCMGLADPVQAMKGLGPDFVSDANNPMAVFVDVNGQNLTIENYLKSQYMFPWNDQKVSQYQTNIRNVDQYVFCTHRTGPGDPRNITTETVYVQKGMPVVTVPLVQNDICQQFDSRSGSQSVKIFGSFCTNIFLALSSIAVAFAFYY